MIRVTDRWAQPASASTGEVAGSRPSSCGDQVLGGREWIWAHALGRPFRVGARSRSDGVGERGKLGRIEQP